MEARGGFTIVELLVSLVLLTVGLIGLQAATGRMVRTVGTIDRETAAAQIVEDRIERIRVEPGYASLSARYAESGTALPDHPGLARETVIARHRDSTATGITDFTRVTVTVDGTGLPRPVSRTVTVARP